MSRVNISSGTIWEDKVGYSRAVKIGNIIEVAGTTSVEKGKVIGINDPYTQTKFILRKIEKALTKAGASFLDVIRTRIYVTDIKMFEQIGKAHGEIFEKIKLASTMVEIKALVDPDMLVEIEATAIISED